MRPTARVVFTKTGLERQAPGPVNGTRGGHEAAALEGSGKSRYKACSEQSPGGELLEVGHRGARFGEACGPDAGVGALETLQLFAQCLS